jgi:hypothetical protein
MLRREGRDFLSSEQYWSLQKYTFDLCSSVVVCWSLEPMVMSSISRTLLRHCEKAKQVGDFFSNFCGLFRKSEPNIYNTFFFTESQSTFKFKKQLQALVQ